MASDSASNRPPVSLAGLGFGFAGYGCLNRWLHYLCNYRFLSHRSIFVTRLFPRRLAALPVRLGADLAFVALEIEKYEAGKAKERQAAKGEVLALMPEVEKGNARDKAATQVGISPRYVQDAKRLEQEAPALAAECKTGKKTITQAMREVKEAARVFDLGGCCYRSGADVEKFGGSCLTNILQICRRF